MNCVSKIGKFLDKNTLTKSKTRMVCHISSDRRKNGLDVTLGIVVKRVRDGVIVECLIDHIVSKASNTNGCNFSTEGFVSQPVESII